MEDGPYKRSPFIGEKLHGGATACKAAASASEFDSRLTDNAADARMLWAPSF